MERIAQNLRLFWRSERLIRRNELRLNIKKVQLTAIAAFVAIFGLVMLSLAAFFALEPLWGRAMSALAVAGFDLALAILLIVVAGGLKPAAEVEMVREARDLALANVEQEVALASAELQALRKDIRHFVRHPLESLLPGMIAPIIRELADGLKAKKAETSESAVENNKAESEQTGNDAESQ
jgi:hypothetical protein